MLVRTLTFAATANAVIYVSAVRVFIDCDATTWTVDPELIEREPQRVRDKGEPASAVTAVDLNGQTCHYDRLREICEHYGSALVGDEAEALGSRHGDVPSGALGDAAALSLNGNKIHTTSGGGMLLTHDERRANEVRYLATQAREPLPHDEHRQDGYNSRLSNLLAELGRAQLHLLDRPGAARRRIYATTRLRRAILQRFTLMSQYAYGTSNCWLICLLVDELEFGAPSQQIARRLVRAGIEARPTWKPMHQHPVFSSSAIVGGGVSEDILTRGPCLPSDSATRSVQQIRVIDAVLECRRQFGGGVT